MMAADRSEDHERSAFWHPSWSSGSSGSSDADTPIIRERLIRDPVSAPWITSNVHIGLLAAQMATHDDPKRVVVRHAADRASLGSIGHAAGKSSPCEFWLMGICKSGGSCQYCHSMQHVGPQGSRQKIECSRALRSYGKNGGCEKSLDEDTMEGKIESL